MKLKKQFIQITLAIFLITQSFFSLYPTEIPITQIKSLASVLKPEYEYLSPIHGAIFCHNDYIENLYRYGNEKDASVKLIKELFFVHHDNVTFDRTYLGIKIAAHFSPQDIGQIIAEIENFKTTFLSKITFSKKGKPLPPLKKETDKLSTTFKRNIKAILDNIAKARHTEVKQSIISYLEIAISRLEQAKINASEEEKTEIDRKITKLGEEKEAEEQNPDKIVHKGFGISKKNFLQLLSRAILEEGVEYVQHHTTYILLSFLWKKVANKNDFLDYFNALSDTLTKQTTDEAAPEAALAPLSNIFTNEDFLSTESGDFLSDTFTAEDYKNITQLSKSEIENINFEALALSYLGFDIFENPLPKEIGMKMNAIFTDTNGQQTSFPDCGETSLRNFLNTILYDSLTKEFDLERLKKLGVSTYSKLYKFYEKYKTATKIHIPEAHNDWANVVSNLSDISYCSREANCEINAGIKNMLKVFNHLIPITTPGKLEPSFDGLTKKLSTINIETEIQEKYTDETNNFGEITFEFSIKKQSPFTINWIFNTGHFQIKYPPQGQIKHAEAFNFSLCGNLESTDNFYLLTKIITFLRNYDYSQNDILEIIKNKKNPSQYIYPILFIEDLHTPRKILDYTKYLANKDSMIDEATKTNIIKKLYKQLPEDDYYTQQDFFKNVSANTNIFHLFANKEFINKSSDMPKTIIFKTIITSPSLSTQEYYKLIKETLSTIKIDWKKTSIIESILDKEIPTNPEKAKLFNFLYQAIEKALPTITDNKAKINIIESILYKKTPDQSEFIKYFHNFYQWINETLPKIENDTSKIVDIIKLILYKEIPNLYQSIQDILPKIKNDTSKVDIIKLILNKEVPKNPELIKHFYDFHKLIQDILPTIKNDKGKANIIESILTQEIPENPELIKYFQGFYQWIQNNLSKIENDYSKACIIRSILAQKIPVNPKFIEYFQNFYQWIQDTLSTITNKWEKENIIYLILNKKIPTNPEQAKLFYDFHKLIQDILPTITDNKAKINIINLILYKEIPENPEQAKLFTILYQAIEKALPAITDNENRTDIINLILYKEIPENPEQAKLFTILYQAIEKALPAITDNENRTDIIESILTQEIPENPEQAKLFTILYQAIEKILPTITDNKGKANIIESILTQEIPENPELIKYFQGFYQWIQNNLSKIENDYSKACIIRSILAQKIPVNPKFIEYFQNFYQWIQDTLSTITNKWEKENIIYLILNKKIPDNPEKIKLFILLYQTIEKLSLIPTDLQEQFISQKTQLEEIIAQ